MSAITANAGGIFKTAALTTLVTCLMFAFGYAMIPLYYKFCAVFGIDVASTDNLVAAIPPVREMRVEFDANSHNDVVSMVPVLRTVQIDTGTAYSVTYEIRNLTNEPQTGIAYPSYAPQRAGAWFTKLQCFCFNELELAPGETLRAPVVFLLEQSLPAEIHTVALSYTFHAKGAKSHGSH